MNPLLLAYLIGAGVFLIVGFIYLIAEAGMDGEYGYDADLRKPVRLLLLSPVWPIAAIYGIYRLAVWAFEAEWRDFGP